MLYSVAVIIMRHKFYETKKKSNQYLIAVTAQAVCNSRTLYYFKV